MSGTTPHPAPGSPAAGRERPDSDPGASRAIECYDGFIQRAGKRGLHRYRQLAQVERRPVQQPRP